MGATLESDLTFGNSKNGVGHKKVGRSKWGMRIAELIENKGMSEWVNRQVEELPGH